MAKNKSRVPASVSNYAIFVVPERLPELQDGSKFTPRAPNDPRMTEG